ncbi:MAG: hypothetical protein M1815_001743 [Lichina confinis]|nr:MAG: hypothetical protein M1815_001743 [Lichina confinis]
MRSPRPTLLPWLGRVLVSIVIVIASFSARTSRAYTPLSDETLRRLPDPGSDFDIHDGALLAPILRPRVPGSAGSLAVLRHFVSFFESSLPDWRLEFQNSTSKTPATGSKEIPFVNLIATRDPPWTEVGEVGRLTLAAHYDSKRTPNGFIGATDSAAPCAMILHAVRSVDKALSKKWAAMQADARGTSLADDEKGVQVILFDGEEAFLTWTDSDSLYGAKSLAETWDSTFHPTLSTFRTRLNSITLFVLLDLLGGPTPSVPSYFRTTHWAYQNLARLEERLRGLSSFKSSPNHPSRAKEGDPAKEPVFLPDSHLFEGSGDHRGPVYGVVQDDHVPFMERGVEVLHLIPHPFPAVWHHLDDDGEHLDVDTVEDWARLTTAFVAEWMDLEGYFTTGVGGQSTKGDDAASGVAGDHEAKGGKATDDGGDVDAVGDGAATSPSATRRIVRRHDEPIEVTETLAVISKTEL